ncbi:MAG: hypothetical protein IPL52_16720 [Flavobacteriales bacterium]|nr:hypothetical protein [Flavobacteriales bacterium]
MEPSDVNHGYVNATDEQRLVQAIDYVEKKINELVYGGKEAYEKAMRLDGNLMHRDRLDLARI